MFKDIYRKIKRYTHVNPSAVPMVWHEPRSHLDNCCVCVTNTTDFSGKSKHKIEYLNIHSELRPIPHDDSVPLPEPSEYYTLESEPESEEASTEAGSSMREDKDFSMYSTVEPHLITQAELNNLFWGLDLPTIKAQLLGSQLQQWNLLEKGVKVSFYRKRHDCICTVHVVRSLNLLTPTHAQLCTYIYIFFLKNHLKNSYMFRSTTIFRELQYPR